MGTRIFRFAGLFGVLLSSLLMNCEPLRDDSIPPSQRLAVNQDALNYYLVPYSSVAVDLKSVFTFSLVNLTLKISANPGRGKLVALPNFVLRYDPSPSFLNGTDQFKLKITETGKEVTIVLNVFASPESFPCAIYAMEDRVCLNPASPAVLLFRANDVICGVPVAKVTASIYVKPEHGSAELKGDTLCYTPAPGYHGPDRLIYKLSTSGSLGFGGEALGIVTIPAEPVISVGITEMHLPEGKVLDITYEASWAIACNDTVQIRIDGPGVYGVDYSTLPSAVSGVVKLPIETGKPSAPIKVTSINDDLFEGSKTIRFQLMNSGSHVLPDTVTKLSVFLDDDEGPSLANFAINQGVLPENYPDGKVLEIPLSAPAKGTGTVTVNVATGGAIYGTHFRTDPEMTNGSLTMNVEPNQTFLQFKVIPIDNPLLTGDLTLSFSIVNVSGVVVTGNTLICSITLDDDERPQSVSFVPTGVQYPDCYYYVCPAMPYSGSQISESESEGVFISIPFSEAAAGDGTITINWLDSSAPCGDPTGYGSSFTTNPAPSSPGTILLTTTLGQTSAGFTFIPVNNQFVGSLYFTFRITSAGGALQKGDLLDHTVYMTDDELPSIAGFSVTSYQGLDESNAAGIQLSIAIDPPAQGPGVVNVSPGGLYGTRFITDPPRTGTYITWNISAGDNGVSFRVIPINNSECGNQYLSFFLTSCGFVRTSNAQNSWVIIVDDDAALASFDQSSGSVQENNTQGITIQVNFSKPTLGQGSLYIQPDVGYALEAKPPLVMEWDYDYYGDYFHYRLDVPAGATSASFTLIAPNDAVDNPNREIIYSISGDGCLRSNANSKYTLTVIDND